MKNTNVSTPPIAIGSLLITGAIYVLIPGSIQEVYNNLCYQEVGAGTLRLIAIGIGGAGRIIECIRLKKPVSEFSGEIALATLNTVQLIQLLVYETLA